MNANLKKEHLSSDLKRVLCSEIVRSVHYLHTEVNRAHLDLKPDNFVITDSYKLALIDFAYCVEADQLT